MSSKHLNCFPTGRLVVAGSLAALIVTAVTTLSVEAQRLERWNAAEGRRFYSDDPIWRDNDMRDIPPVTAFDLSKSYEYVNETFGDSITSRGRALNVNTLDEVPDSSWFTNRLGRHD